MKDTHVAMLDGRANQLTEMVPPSRIFGSISAFKQKNATAAFILNVSDMLPYIMGTMANFRAVYDPSAYFCNSTIGTQCSDLQSKWIAQWSAQLFRISQDDAATVARAYGQYFAVPYINDGNADDLIANLLNSAAEQIGNEVQQQRFTVGTNYNWTSSAQALCAAYADVQKVAGNVPASRQQAYATTILNSLGYHCKVVSALAATLNAQAAFHAGDAKSAAQLLYGVVATLDELAMVQHAAEGPLFRGLFVYDDLTCTPRARRSALGALARLEASASSKMRDWAYKQDIISCRGYEGMCV
jgi:hypothetical protein